MAITGTSTFKDIMNVQQFRDQQHQDKALKGSGSTPLYQSSSLLSHTTQKREGSDFIKGALNREFGAQFGVNFGERVFARANTYKHGLDLDSVVKGRDLQHIERASHQIRAEDTIGSLRVALARHQHGPINGAEVTKLLDILNDGLVRDGTKLEAEQLLRDSLGRIDTFDAMKTALSVDGKPLTPQQGERLADLKRGNGDFSFDEAHRELIQEAVTPGGGGVTPGNRLALQAQLPLGATVGVTGQIGGVTTINSFGGIFKLETGMDAPSFVDVMKSIGDKSLATEGSKLSNGLTIGTQAEKDLYRMNITMNDGVNPPYSSITERNRITREKGTDSVPKETNLSITNAMRDLANGSAPTVRVLSAVINQQFSTPFVRGLSLVDGSSFAPAICGLKDGQQQVGTPLGPETRDPGGIGTSDVRITKRPNGDYQVDITYPFTMKRPSMDGDSRFAGSGDMSVQGTGRVSYIIDGALAALGKLSMTPNGLPTVTWDGHMTV